MVIGSSKAEPFWTKFLRSLTERISDSHERFKKAARKVLGATWQHCRGRSLSTHIRLPTTLLF
jgi:putative transposase